MIEAAEALRLIACETQSRICRADLEECQGLVLAEDIVADRDYPPFHRAAMDGFAVRSVEFLQGNQFHPMPAVFAGQQRTETRPRAAVKIMTGAPVPESFDAVVRVEDSRIENGTVFLSPAKFAPWLNIAKRAEDASARDVVVPRGTRANAAVLAAAAACGYAKVSVYARPQVDIVTTGNEIKDISERPGPAEIRNSNRYTLAALCGHFGIKPRIYHVPDDPSAIEQRLRASMETADILLLSGGVSAGDADYVPAALKRCGVTELFHKVNIRPGKPLYCGRTSALVFGLPGNPVSCHTTARVFVEPALRAFMQLETTMQTIRIAHPVAKKHSMQEYVRVKRDETQRAAAVPHNGSGDLFASTRADGLAVIPADTHECSAGSQLEYLPFGW